MHWLLGGYMWLFIHRPFEVWPALGVIRLERVYMLATLVCWVCYAHKQWVANRLNAAYLCFLLTLVAAWLASPYGNEGTKTVEDCFKVAIFYVLVMSTVRGEDGLKRLMLMYVAALALYMSHSLWEYCNGRFVYRMGTVRMVGVDSTYNDPNTFSATILYSLPMVLPFWALVKSWWQRGLFVGYIGLSMICIVLSGSRSAFIGLSLLSVAVSLLSPHRMKLLLLIALAAPVGWTMLPEQIQNRFLTIIDPSYGPKNAQTSAEGRAQGWRDGVAMWQRSPLLGVGPNGFTSARGYNLQSHHLYGQVLGEVGTLGAIAFGMIVLSFFANARAMRALCQQLPERLGTFPQQVCGAVMISVWLLLLMGFAGHNLYRYTWMWFGAFQAIALHCTKEEG